MSRLIRQDDAEYSKFRFPERKTMSAGPVEQQLRYGRDENYYRDGALKRNLEIIPTPYPEKLALFRTGGKIKKGRTTQRQKQSGPRTGVRGTLKQKQRQTVIVNVNSNNKRSKRTSSSSKASQPNFTLLPTSQTYVTNNTPTPTPTINFGSNPFTPNPVLPTVDQSTFTSSSSHGSGYDGYGGGGGGSSSTAAATWDGGKSRSEKFFGSTLIPSSLLPEPKKTILESTVASIGRAGPADIVPPTYKAPLFFEDEKTTRKDRDDHTKKLVDMGLISTGIIGDTSFIPAAPSLLDLFEDEKADVSPPVPKALTVRKCSYCGKQGHNIQTCPQKKADDAGKGKGNLLDQIKSGTKLKKPQPLPDKPPKTNMITSDTSVLDKLKQRRKNFKNSDDDD